jgi:putative SOS response-associated peptidase YedK
VLLATPEEQQRWLQSDDLGEVLMLLRPPAEGLLRKYRVSDLLNNVASNAADLHLEVPEQPTLFD